MIDRSRNDYEIHFWSSRRWSILVSKRSVPDICFPSQVAALNSCPNPEDIRELWMMTVRVVSLNFSETWTQAAVLKTLSIKTSSPHYNKAQWNFESPAAVGLFLTTCNASSGSHSSVIEGHLTCGDGLHWQVLEVIANIIWVFLLMWLNYRATIRILNWKYMLLWLLHPRYLSCSTLVLDLFN